MADLLESFRLLKQWPDDALCRAQRKELGRELLESGRGSIDDLNEASQLWMGEQPNLCYRAVGEMVHYLDEQQATGAVTYWTKRERSRACATFQRIARAHGHARQLTIAESRASLPQKTEHLVEVSTDGGALGLGPRRRVIAARAAGRDLEDEGILRFDTGGDGIFEVLVKVVPTPRSRGQRLEVEADGRLILFGIGASVIEMIVPPGIYRAQVLAAGPGRFSVSLYSAK